jgi:phage N-6-adenine-methyltransferase
MRRRKEEPVYFRHKADEWETPASLFAELDREFCFTLDLAALPHNAKCPRYYTPGMNSLKRMWGGTCFLNPPYGKELGRWVRKAHESALCGAVIVCLLPARTDTAWFHAYVLPYAELRFLKGRLQFKGIGTSAPFPSMLAIFRPSIVPPNRSR